MNRSAKVTAIDALEEFKVALAEYAAKMGNTLTSLELEIRRALDWIESDRTRYWPNQVRRASDAVIEARNNLERCELSIHAGDSPPCYAEKKLLERARQRLRTCEDKVSVVRGWRRTLNHQTEEFQGQLCRMGQVVEIDMARGKAALERMIKALDMYAQRSQPVPGDMGKEKS